MESVRKSPESAFDDRLRDAAGRIPTRIVQGRRYGPPAVSGLSPLSTCKSRATGLTPRPQSYQITFIKYSLIRLIWHDQGLECDLVDPGPQPGDAAVGLRGGVFADPDQLRVAQGQGRLVEDLPGDVTSPWLQPWGT